MKPFTSFIHILLLVPYILYINVNVCTVLNMYIRSCTVPKVPRVPYVPWGRQRLVCATSVHT